MAPEVTNMTASTQASDVYSYGVLMMDIMKRVPGVPSRCLRKVKSALKRDPKKRPRLEKILKCLKRSLIRRRRDASPKVSPQVPQETLPSVWLKVPSLTSPMVETYKDKSPFVPRKILSPLPESIPLSDKDLPTLSENIEEMFELSCAAKALESLGGEIMMLSPIKTLEAYETQKKTTPVACEETADLQVPSENQAPKKLKPGLSR